MSLMNVELRINKIYDFQKRIKNVTKVTAGELNTRVSNVLIPIIIRTNAEPTLSITVKC